MSLRSRKLCRRNGFLTLTAYLSLAAGCTSETVGASAGSITMGSGWDPPSFFFKPGLPQAGGRMIGSTDERFTDTKAMLKDAIGMMKRFPDWRFEIRAYTDDRECAGQECVALSLRRATVVRAWLLEHGAPASSLKPLKAFGSAMPLADNAVEQGRRINRRVEFGVELPD